MKKMEMLRNYDELIKEEVDRIIRTYPERLKDAVSIFEETQKILEEEGATDPELKELLPLKVMETIRTKGKHGTFKGSEDETYSMSRYAKESKGSAGSRYDAEERNREREDDERKDSIPASEKEETKDPE